MNRPKTKLEFLRALPACLPMVLGMGMLAGAVQAYDASPAGPAHGFPGVQGRLAQAAMDGDAAEIRRQVSQGADPNYRNDRGETALTHALRAHSDAGVKTLLELGADPNIPAPDGTTATLIAADGEDYAMLKTLLEHGGNPNVVSHCKTPLMAVVAGKDTQRIRLLLDHGADPNAEACELTAPEVALVVGRFDIASYLMTRGYGVRLERLAHRAAGTPAGDPQARSDKQQLLETLKQRGAMP